jgi:hypothetical protein
MRITVLSLSSLLLASASFAQPPGGGAGQGLPTNEVIFERNDTNKDGVITAAEAAAAGTQLGQQFSTWDTNSDGKVTNEELDAGRGRLGGAGRAGGPAAPGAGRAGGPPAAAEPDDETVD